MTVQNSATQEANQNLTDDDFDVDIRINARADDDGERAGDSVGSFVSCHSCATCTCPNNC